MESHDDVSKENAMEATQLLYQTLERAEGGQYTVLAIAHKFIECIDATITKNGMSSRGSKEKVKTAFMVNQMMDASTVCSNEETADSLSTQVEQIEELEVKDLEDDEGELEIAGVPLMAQLPVMQLRTVNPFQDE